MVKKFRLSVCGFAPSLTGAYVTEPQDESRSQIRVPKWNDFCGAGKDVRRIKYNEMGVEGNGEELPEMTKLPKNPN
jgi:hypothetical protein